MGPGLRQYQVHEGGERAAGRKWIHIEGDDDDDKSRQTIPIIIIMKKHKGNSRIDCIFHPHIHIVR